MIPPIPSASTAKRGRITFTMQRLDHPVSVPGGGWFIAAQNANGSGFTQITTSPHSAYNFAWSPDGSRIAYTLNVYTNVPGFMSTKPADSFAELLKATADFYGNLQQNVQSMLRMQIMPQLCMIDANGMNDHAFKDIYASQFAWSPDGTQLVLITSSDWLEVIKADGSNRRQLMKVSTQTYLGGFSPDGKRLLLADKAVYTVKLDGTDRHDMSVSSEQNIFPCWSPDGSEIAFIGYQNNSATLYVIKSDGSDLRELAPINNFEDVGVAWSPKGEEIAYVSFPPDNDDYAEKEALWVIAVDGRSMPRKLAEIYSEDAIGDELNVSAPVWSAHENRIAFLALYDADEFSHDIYLINPDGSDLRRITDDGELKNNLAWQPGQ